MTEPLVAVEVTDLSKMFRKSSEPSKTLKERLLTWRQSTTQEFHAFHVVNCDRADVGRHHGDVIHIGPHRLLARQVDVIGADAPN